MRRLERLLAIALLLGARRRALAQEVAAEFGVSLRTVYRDVRALIDAGFPVEGNAGDGYRLSQESYLRPLALTGDEAEALAVAAHALGASVSAAMRESLARATSKLEASFDRPTRRRVSDLRSRIVVPELARRTSGPTAEMLEAIRERRVAHVGYDEPGSGVHTERDVEPLGFVCRGDAWWLVAWCRLRGDARAFRVDRIATWKTRGASYPPREGFSFADIVARDGHLAPVLFGY